MNIKKILFFLSVMCMLLASSAVGLFAETETRNIYIGDIITLEITSQQFSEDELREKFQDFEVVEIKSESNGYLLSLRTFDVGEQKIALGNTEIIINVISTLDDIHKEAIFEGDKQIISPGLPFPWYVLFGVFALVFVASGVFVLVKIIIKKKAESLSPYETFLRRSEALLPRVDSDSFFVNLTFYFKEYIGKLHQRRIIGKTSSEIIKELEEIKTLASMIPMIDKWLVECDRMKFTGVEVLNEDKQKHYDLLLKLAGIIEENAQKEVTA